MVDSNNIIVFDLEVVALDFESTYDQDTKDYLLKYARTEEDKLAAIDGLVFSPFTSQIVSIGMWDYRKATGCVLINTGDEPSEVISDNENVKYIVSNEKGIVDKFWSIVQKKECEHYVTFNGREFDCPFLMLRSLILRSKPTCNLMKGGDYSYSHYHTDLLKELTYHKHSPQGARRKFSLDFYCKMLGVPSPKAGGVKGDMVGELYKNKEYKVIADYCIADVIATADLFSIWNDNTYKS